MHMVLPAPPERVLVVSGDVSMRVNQDDQLIPTDHTLTQQQQARQLYSYDMSYSFPAVRESLIVPHSVLRRY
jgi:hypothetical protein